MRQLRDHHTSKESGLWAAVPSAIPLPAQGNEDEREERAVRAPISWLPRPKLWRRVVRSMNMPTAVGIGAFVIALVVTASIMVQGLIGDSQSGVDSSVNDKEGVASSGSAVELVGTAQASAKEEALEHPGVVLVHVVGEVKQPGVVEIAADSRVVDAIEAAGGASDLAVLSAINLARTVSDGEQLVVPDAAEALEIAAGGAGGAGATGAASAAHTGAGSAGNSGQAGVVNLNTASIDQLVQLPKVGPAIAQRIVDWREANGGFGSVDQLLEVNGIGAKTLNGFRDQVSI